MPPMRVYAADTALDVSVRLGALEDVGRSESAELGLRVFVGQRSASVSTSDLSTDALAALVERAVAMAREAPEDAWAGLAPAGPAAARRAAAARSRRWRRGRRPRSLQATPRSRPRMPRAPSPASPTAKAAAASAGALDLGARHQPRLRRAPMRRPATASRPACSRARAAAMVRDYAYHSARHRAHLDDADDDRPRAGERAVARRQSGPARERRRCRWCSIRASGRACSAI